MKRLCQDIGVYICVSCFGSIDIGLKSTLEFFSDSKHCTYLSFTFQFFNVWERIKKAVAFPFDIAAQVGVKQILVRTSILGK